MCSVSTNHNNIKTIIIIIINTKILRKKKKTNEKKKLNIVIPLKFQQCVGKFAEILFINWKRKKMKKKKIGMKTESEKHGKKTRNSLRLKRMCISFFIYYTFFFPFVLFN